MGKQRPGKTSAVAVRAREREKLALKLRLAGYDFTAIAEQLGTSRQGAWKAVNRVLERKRKEADKLAGKYLDIQIERFEEMLKGVWPKAVAGDPAAIDRAIKLIEKVMFYRGMEPPIKVAQTDSKGQDVKYTVPASELLAMLEALERKRAAGGESV